MTDKGMSNLLGLILRRSISNVGVVLKRGGPDYAMAGQCSVVQCNAVQCSAVQYYEQGSSVLGAGLWGLLEVEDRRLLSRNLCKLTIACYPNICKAITC